jgi:hypothetical protein
MMMKTTVTPTWDDMSDRRSIWLNIMARLRPGVSRKQAQAAMTVLYHQEQSEDAKANPEASANFRKKFLKNKFTLTDAAKGVSSLREKFSTPLVVLMAMVGTLLLIACGNVANPLVARAATRQRDLDPPFARSQQGCDFSARIHRETAAVAGAWRTRIAGCFLDWSPAVTVPAIRERGAGLLDFTRRPHFVAKSAREPDISYSLSLAGGVPHLLGDRVPSPGGQYSLTFSNNHAAIRRVTDGKTYSLERRDADPGSTAWSPHDKHFAIVFHQPGTSTPDRVEVLGAESGRGATVASSASRRIDGIALLSDHELVYYKERICTADRTQSLCGRP